jgi:predicted nuclease of predicted toxin-antitoxin system
VKLLADENQHPRVVVRLREAGFEVEYVRETTPGAKDEEILARTDIGHLVLLTYDRDFGDLIFNRGYPAPAAILYTRLDRKAPEAVADRFIAVLEAGIAWNYITTITEDA